MISRLRGTVGKLQPGTLVVDVNGVGYKLTVPVPVWDSVTEGETQQFAVSSYIREDRFDLYGFLEENDRMLFERFIDMPGIGPKMGLELCSVPKTLLEDALMKEDPKLLTAVKGVGKKSAEKLLIELKNLCEKEPSLLMRGRASGIASGAFDPDAVAALSQLGYATSEILQALEKLPKNLASTEEKVTAALRAL